MNSTECPECDRPLAPTDRRGERACHNCNEKFQIAQCEGCGDHYVESKFVTESVPGATLWWCPDCASGRTFA